MSTPYLMTILVLALVIMLILVIKFKINAAIALIFASLFMGIGAKVPLDELVTELGGGFGNFMSTTGLTIGLGVILGQILYDYGGANSIATSMIHGFPKNKVFYAMALSAFIISIPVFFDVTFILLAPLGISVARQIKAPMYKVCIALLLGASLAHTCTPPAPAPLSAAGIMNVDVGIMLAVGCVIGIIAMVLTIKITDRIFAHNFWNPETDEAGSTGNREAVEPLLPADKEAPGPLVSMIPILVPIAALMTHTIWNAVAGEVPPIIGFLGSKSIAMFLGVVAALLIGRTRLSWDQLSDSCGNALKSAGVVLMITGTGAAFGKILSVSGVTDAITNMITDMNANVVIIILVAYLIAAALRIAQGSATVACITSVSIIAETVAKLGYNPLFICLAACAGALSVGHVNDSGFWIMVSRCGFTVKGGLKCVTLTEVIMSLILLTECLILGAFF